jgi:fibronectin-binding autotransporter adhesin
MGANSGAAIFAVLVGAGLIPTGAQAQSVWGGPASTTATPDYKLGSNWDPNAAPLVAGQSAVFGADGNSTVTVGAGAIAPDSWTFNANSQSYTITGADVNFSLAGASGGIINNAGQAITISNNIGESAAGVQLQQLGSSTLKLSGNNTYTGGTTITSGTILVTDNHSVGTGAITLDGGTFKFDTGVTGFGFAQDIKINAAGGTIDNNGGFMQLGGSIVDGNATTGVLVVTDSSALGGGTTVLGGFQSSYSGGTYVLNATLALQYGAAVGTGLVTLENARFMAYVNVPSGSLSFSNNFAINDTASGSTIDVNGYPMTISGVIADGNGPGKLTVTDTLGGGVLVLTGANTYTGGTTLSAGTLTIGNSSALGSGDLSMAPGTTLSFDTLAAYNVANNISIAGDPIFNVAAGPAQTVSGVISDTDPVNNPGIVEKNGAGTLILSGDNSYSGGTIINAGTLQVTTSNPGVSGSVGTGDVTLNGGTFQTDGFANLEFSNNFKINTAGGAVDNNGTFLTLSGIISNGNGSTGVLQIKDSSGGFGTTLLSGVNTYSGGTKVIGATLQVNNNDSVGGGLVTLENGLFQVADAIVTPTLSLGNNFAINNTPSGSAIDVNGYSLTISGNIADGNGPGKLTVLDSFGGGVLILTGTNTYSGGTDICNCGTLQLGTTGTMGSIVGAVTNQGHFDIVNANTAGITSIFNDAGLTNFYNATTADAMTITNRFGGTVAFYDSSTAGSATINNNVGGFTEFGVAFGTDAPSAGTATITNNNFGITEFNASSTASDAKIITNNGGELDFWDTSTAGNAAITTNAGGATYLNDNASGGTARFITNGTGFVDFSGGVGPNSDGRITAGSIEGSGSYYIGGGNTLVVGGNNLSTEVSGVIADNNPCGCTTGPGALEKVGTGTLTLSGTNTYTGGTTITAGTLQLGNGGTTGSILGDVTNNAALVFNRSNIYQFDGVISGSGSVQQNGSGMIVLTADNSYGGGTTIAAGTLQLGNGTATGSILGDVTNNATLAFNRSNSYQFDGVISGSGAVQQDGAGTATLTAVNTYAGATTIGAGTLALSGAGSIANSSGVIDNGIFDISATTAGASIKTLSGAGNVTLGNQTLTLTNASGTFAGAIDGNGGLIKQGAGLFTLSGTNSYLGATTVAGGELRVNGSVASAVNVQSGATLSGIGSVGGLVTVQSGGTLSAGQSPGTLTLGALNLSTGSTSAFELGSAGVVGGSSNDLVNVTGNLTLGGTLSVNAPSAGYYRLFNYGTLTSSSFDTVNGSSNGTPTVLTNVPNQVNLLIAAAGQQVQFWDGADQTGNGVVNGGAGTWNAANTNWTGAPGQAGINDQWRSSVGVFAGTAGTVTIAGTQAFDTLQFSTTGYVLNAGAGGQLQLAGLSGTGTINTDNGVATTIAAPIVNGSSTSLTKVGGGTLILTGANTYSGGTIISGGTLQIGNGGLTGSIVGNVTDNGVFAINRFDAVSFAGTISGSGAFQQLGRGTTTLTADNTYNGGTIISAGTLQLGNGGATGSVTGNIVDNATLTINRSNVLVLSGVISGTGGLRLIGTGSTTLTAANTYTGGTMVFSTLNLAAAAGITSNVVVTGSGAFNNSGSVAGTVQNGGTFNNNAGGTVSGLLDNSGGTAINNGQLNGGVNNSFATLTNNNLISGAVVNSGILNNNATITGAVTNTEIFNNNANGTVSGLLTNLHEFGEVNNAGQLNGGALVLNGILTNNNLISGTVESIFSGTVNNNAAITGDVFNAATFNNSSNGTVSGLFTGSTNGVAQNAGHLNGGVNMRAGTLNTTGTILGGVINAGTINANGGVINGAIANNAGGTFNVGGTVTSDNIFTNAASATLAIGASGAYTLQGLLTNSGVVTVASGGQLIATVGGITNNAGGTITVALGGTVKDDLNNAGAITNNGVYIANVASNTGTIDNNKTWTGTVSNAGTFNNSAGATVSGLLTNTAGTTTNNGALNGGANVSGGTFTGSGTVASLTVSGGVFAPGNGTPGSSMTITGNLAFQSGALYLVQLNPASSTSAKVTGAAALNGGAGAAFLAGNYVAKQYTILTAAGGVSGTFGSFDTLGIPSGFRASLSYDANDVFLNLEVALAKYSGLNVNQQNVANALTSFFNATGGIPAVFGTLTPGGLTQVSGEIATASQQTTFEAMNLFLGLLTDPFVAGRGEPVAAATPAPQFAEESDASAYASTGKRSKGEREAYAAIYNKAPMRNTVYDPHWSVWAAGFGGSQTTDGNTALGSNTATSRVFGTAVGADYLFSPRTIAGFAVAGGGTSFSVNGLGTGRSDLFQAGAFVRHTSGPAYVSAALAYGWQDVTTDRTVTIAGADLLRARFNANAFSGRVEGGYRFVTPWMAMGITPYAAGQFTTFDLPSYVEQAIAGANTFALTYGAKSVTASRSELGVRTDKSFVMQDGIFTLRGRAAWAHNFDPDRNIAATFQTLPGASFVVNGAAQASDSALVTASAEMKWLNGFSLAATFEGEFSNVTSSYAGKGVVRYAW